MTTAEAIRKLCGLLAPPPDQPWYEWAASGGIILSTRVPTARPGPYDVNFTPALRGIAAALDDPDIWCVVLKKGAQIGATQLVYSWFLSRVKFDPGPALFVLANEKLCRQRSQNTVRPMVEDSPELAALIAAGRDSMSDLSYRFTASTLYWVGGNSASGLSSNPIRYLYIDEENKFQDEIEEGDNSELAIQRTKTFWNRKVARTCSPTVETGRISVAHLSGDQRFYFVPCPKCGHMQRILWKNVKWPDGKPEDAHLVCDAESCGHEWSDRERKESLHHGEWRASAQAKRAGVASFHLSSLYSPFVSISDLACKFMDAKDTPSRLRDFINSDLAEDWKPDTIEAKSDDLRECRAAYKHGQDPECVPEIAAVVGKAQSLIIAAIDVQAKGFWVRAVKYWEGGHSARLRFAHCQSWDECEAFLKEYSPHTVMVDSGDGNRTEEIYGECMKRPNWWPCKGASGSLDWIFRRTAVDVVDGNRKSGESSVPLILIDTGACKMNLVARMSGSAKAKFWIPFDASAEEVAQITAERYNAESDKWELKPRRKDNHLLDCEVMCYVAATAEGLNNTQGAT